MLTDFVTYSNKRTLISKIIWSSIEIVIVFECLVPKVS
jgi:hypothetical protein